GVQPCGVGRYWRPGPRKLQSPSSSRARQPKGHLTCVRRAVAGFRAGRRSAVGEVVTLDLVTRLDIPAERILHQALDAGMNGAVVIGYDKDDGFYFASSIADGGTVL